MDNNEIEKLLNISEDSVRIVEPSEAEAFKDDDFYDGISQDDKNEPLLPNIPVVPKVIDQQEFEPPSSSFLKEEAKEEHFKSSEDLLNFSEPSIVETPKKIEKPKKAKNDDIEDIKILRSDDVKPGERAFLKNISLHLAG
jgi:hypothetical protein